jgi:hypothetical protein
MRESKLVGIISRANIVRAVGGTRGAPQRAGEGDDRSIRAGVGQLSPPDLALDNEFEPGPMQIIGFYTSFRRGRVAE